MHAASRDTVTDLTAAVAAQMLARLLAVLTPGVMLCATPGCGGTSRLDAADVDATVQPDADATVASDADASLQLDADASLQLDADAALQPDEATLPSDADATLGPQDAFDAPTFPPVPVPDGGFPYCTGLPSPEAGPCCQDVYCFAPDAGRACPAGLDLTNIEISDLTHRFVGSGTCWCSRSGPFDPTSAAQFTDAGGPCCYVIGLQSCLGRPFIVDGQQRLAAATRRPSDRRSTEDLVTGNPRLSLRLSETWTQNGLLEHASIASFARFSLQLLAVGAPIDLVRRAHEAALDEVAHAELCFELASRYGAANVTAGELPLGGTVVESVELGDLALAAFEEGCIGETLGALEAAIASTMATSPNIKATLERIADDEGRHAELAWLFVRWALSVGGSSIRERLARAVERAAEAAATFRPRAESDVEALNEHGILSDGQRDALKARGLLDVVVPAARGILGAAAERK
jgi:hypothetical protein